MPKVLVIDDSVSVRKVVERALAGRQVDVICAASGTEALECMERDAPDFIVCDVVMPDRDGYEICEFVKKHPRLGDIPVLLMSGIVNDEVKQRAARARSEGVLAKPFAAEDLLKRLDGFLGPLPPRVADAPVPKAAAPSPPANGAPTLMPVSTLTVPPVEAPKPVSAFAPKPAAVIAPKPAPGVTPKPVPLMTPKPAPVVTSTPAPVVAPPPPLDPAAAPLATAEPKPAAIESVAPTLRPPAPPEREAPVVPAAKAAPAAVEPIAAEPPPPAPTDAAAGILAQFTAMDGVQWAVLSDREGFVVEATTNAGVDADVAAALSACLAESSDGVGKELGRGTLHSIILEYEKGIVVVYGAGAGGLLAVGLTESSVLGKVRYFAKKALPELMRSL
jgi:CheY-like chemotaxis protein/predicted regulator of Ras-like GTPase activity (Roadblock/LC7/MglB family)